MKTKPPFARSIVMSGTALSLLLTMAACGTDGAETATASEIKVGAWLPLSGQVAPYGVPGRAGVEAYISTIPDGKINGRTIKFVAEDNGYDVAQTVAIARKLVDQEKVFALVGSNGTGPSAATLDYLKSTDTPLLMGSGGDQSFYDPVRSNVFGTQVTMEAQGQILADWVMDDGIKDAALVYYTGSAGETGNTAFTDSFKALGGTTTSYSYKLGNTDWSPMVRQLAEKKHGAVVFFADVSSVTGLIKEAARQKVSLNPYGWNSLAGTDKVRLLEDLSEGFKAIDPTMSPDSDTPEMKAYVAALKEVAPDEIPGANSALVYATMQIFTEALKNIDGEPTHAKLYEALENIKSFETGILPPVSFDATHHLATACMYRTDVKDGKVVQLQEAASCAAGAGNVAILN